MTIDEAISHAREVAVNESCEKCAEEHNQLAEWLEELKIYKESNISIKNYQQGRADMLDKLKKYAESRLDMRFALDILCKEVIDEFIAEQIKEQK